MVRKDFYEPIKALVLCQLGRGRWLHYLAAKPSPQLLDVNFAPDRFVHSLVKNEVITQDKPKKLLVRILWSQVAAVLEVKSVPMGAYVP